MAPNSTTSIPESSQRTPTPSDAGTTTSRATSASKLPDDANNFRGWARAVNLDTNINAELPADPFFDRIRYLQNIASTFPDWLANTASPQFNYIPKAYRKVLDALYFEVAGRFRFRSYQPDFSRPDQDPKLPAAIPIILQTYHHHKTTASLPETATKIDMRVGIDNLIAHIYDVDRSESAKYWRDGAQLELPSSKGVSANSLIIVATFKTDAMSFLIFPQFKAYDGSRDVQMALVAYGTGEHRDLIVVHSVVGYKRTDSGANQTLMGLVSGLYQRRGLNMPNHFVFDKVGGYTMKDAITTVQFYLVIRGIKQFAHEYYEELKTSEESFPLAVKNNPPTNEWVKKPMQGIPETSGYSENSEGPQQSGEAARTGQGEGLSDYLADRGDLDRYERTSVLSSTASTPTKCICGNKPDTSADGLDIPLTPPLDTPPTSGRNK
ncbi:unnamed protein product [Rhizoctonia solani]|uniref:Uncharacterized protein n=1 Tax=Rhizoctonia solani TaxID=456999 RepID=A0A8H2XM42_9AGAM|nr:unnamed protein product [Rhizoctonia solani]